MLTRLLVILVHNDEIGEVVLLGLTNDALYRDALSREELRVRNTLAQLEAEFPRFLE